MSFFLRFSVVGLIVASGCAKEPPVTPAAEKAATPFGIDWPAPNGWRTEDIPFPLKFAPSIPYKGYETLRFGPKFLDPASETYFTYSFAFVLDDAPAFTATALATELETYFTGLMSAVTKKPSPRELHAASLAADGQKDGRDRFKGTVKTVDGFGDGRRLDLVVEGESFVCRGHRIVLTSLSPHESGHPVWRTLADLRASFRCT
jgi:hypothetical protein